MGRRKQPLEQLQRSTVADIALGGAMARIPERAVEEMATSLKAQGQLEPVLLLPQGHSNGDAPDAGAGQAAAEAGKPSMRLVTGRRRLLAARSLGWKQLDSIVLPPGCAAQAEVIWRLHQGKASSWELLDAFLVLKTKCGWTQTHLGMAIGRTRDYVANLLSLGNIQPPVRELLQQEGQPVLTLRHLRHIARTPAEDQLAETERILAERLSSTRLERGQNGHGNKAPGQRLTVRPFRKKNEPDYPRTVQEWRRYQRQLVTDLNRLERDEKALRQRDAALVAEARQRLRALRSEANQKRRRLHKELRMALRNLS